MACEHRTKCDALRKCSIATIGRDSTGASNAGASVDKPIINNSSAGVDNRTSNNSSALGSDECAGNIVAGFFESQFIKS